MPNGWLETLNEEQREAVTHRGGPLLVIAGAGSGKTRTLACRVAWLLKEGVPPSRMLLLTFTRRAAAEMLERARRIVGGDRARQVWGGTFHSVGYRLLRQYGGHVGLEGGFVVLDRGDSADLLNLVRDELGVGTRGRRFPQKQTLLDIYSRTVNSRLPLPEVLARHFPWCERERPDIARIFEEYTRRKRAQRLLDYDDILLFWNALCDLPGIGERIADHFEHILVDEYQDTNTIQAEILRRMRARRREITVVGDPAQAIYAFRGATVRNILEFPKEFPDARTVALPQNYRSTQAILDAANAVMARSSMSPSIRLVSRRGAGEKPELVTCQDDAEQSVVICERILALREAGVGLERQAVLFRAAYLSDGLELELARRNIPFVKYGGLRFLEAAHVKDLLALLRILENPFDTLSWFRILQLLEGIGPRQARRLMTELGVQGRAPTGAEPLARLLFAPPEPPSAARESWKTLRQALAAALGLPPEALATRAPARFPAEEPPVPVQIEALRAFYDPLLERHHDNAIERRRDLEQLQQIAARYLDRAAFLADLTLDPPAATQDLAGQPLQDGECLTLSTIHSAKGCEWDAVHLIHVADGLLPSDLATGSDEELEEERRLLYVAMTRARNTLILYFPLRHYVGGWRTDRHTWAQLTRFIPREDDALYRRSGARHPERPRSESANAPGLTARIDAAAAVDADLRRLW